MPDSAILLFLAVACNCALFAAIWFYMRRIGLRKTELDIWSIIFFSAIMITIVGANIFLFTDAKMTFGMDSVVSDAVRVRVYIDYYVSWIVLFLIFGVGRDLIKLPDRRLGFVRWSKYRNANLFDYAVLALAVLLLLADMVLIGDLPGVHALSGNTAASALAKANFMENRMRSGIPILGYLMRYFPIFAFAWLFDRYYSANKKIGFMILAVVMLTYSGLTMVKSYILPPIIAATIVYFSYSKTRLSGRLIIRLGLLAVIGISLPFYLLAGSVSQELAILVVQRVFTVQIEGAFVIRSIFQDMRLDALLEGAPLLSRFGVETMDPAAEAIIRVFGEVPGWVNMNSHYIGQGYVMFGSWITIIGPLIIYVNAAMLVLLSRTIPIGPMQHISSLVVVTCAIYFPINNNFGNAVYMKSLVAFGIIYALVFLLSRVATPVPASVLDGSENSDVKTGLI